MARQRQQPHLRFERQADGIEVEPLFTGIIIKFPVRPMGDMPANISQVVKLTRPVHEGLIFLAVDMDLRPGEIRQATAVVEVHVGQHDVTHILRFVPQADHLPDGGLTRDPEEQP